MAGEWAARREGLAALVAQVASLQQQINDLRAAASVRNAAISSPDGQRIEILPTPEIRMYPSSGDAYASLFAAPESISGATEAWFGLKAATNSSGEFFGVAADPNHLRAGYMHDPDWLARGGLAYTDATQAIVGAYQANVIQSGLRCGTDGHLNLSGAWWDNSVYAADTGDAVLAGSVAFGAATSISVSYGPTMASVPKVVYGILNSSGTYPGHKLTAQSATGFTVGLSASLAVTLNWWAAQVA